MIAELTKSGNLSMREILVVTSAYARPPARTDSWGGGDGSLKATRRGVKNAIFSDRKSTTWPPVSRTLDFQYILGLKTLQAHHEKKKT